MKIVNKNQTDLILTKNPKSRFAEAIKLIRTNLAFSAIDKEIKTILITSAEEGDGKSFISSNLAVAYSQDNKKVLMIDCDLRRGRLHKIFKVLNKSDLGYSNLILNYKSETKKTKTETKTTTKKKESFDISKYIIKTEVENLSIIPSGPVPPNPVELLSSLNNEKLIKELRKKFDIIILDCPPVLGLSDVLIEAKNSDVNILVVTNKKTKEESLAKTVKVFEQSNLKINGVIFNKDKVKNSSYYCNSYYKEN